VSLADLVTQHRKSESYPKPFGEASPNGIRAEVGWCDKGHGEYTRFVIPGGRSAGDAYRIGECKECAADAELDRQAREILAGRRGELIQRIKIDDAQVAREVEEAMAVHVSDLRRALEQQISAAHRQRARDAAEHEMLQEIIEELRTKGENAQ